MSQLKTWLRLTVRRLLQHGGLLTFSILIRRHAARLHLRPVASGNLTIAREIAEQTGFALFHNHLVVDSVDAVFPFGSELFARLRKLF